MNHLTFDVDVDVDVDVDDVDDGFVSIAAVPSMPVYRHGTVTAEVEQVLDRTWLPFLISHGIVDDEMDWPHDRRGVLGDLRKSPRTDQPVCGASAWRASCSLCA